MRRGVVSGYKSRGLENYNTGRKGREGGKDEEE